MCSLPNDNTPALDSEICYYHQWTTLSVAVYQRGPHVPLVPDWQRDNQWRFLIVGVGTSFDKTLPINSTWSYDPFINSWIRLPLRIQPARWYYTLNTWCNTSVILFGGGDDRRSMSFNDTWLFDGVTETWKEQEVKLWKAGYFLRPRFGHTAVTIRQPLSNCTCQESLLVYGGSSIDKECYGDLWEMRCIVDLYEKQQFYWISLTKGDDADWPKLLDQRASDFNKRSMYMWGGGDCKRNQQPTEGVWEYDLMSSMWKHHKQVANHLLQTCNFSDALSFFYSRLEGIVTFDAACVPYTLKSSHETLQFDVMGINWTYQDGPNACAVGGENIFCFAVLYDSTTVHRLDYDRNHAGWQLVAMPSPQVRSCARDISRGYHFVGTSFYVEENIDNNACYVGEENANARFGYVLSLWQFDLHIKSWFQTAHPFAPLWENGATYSTMNNTILVRYFPSKLSNDVTNTADDKNITTAIWLYDTMIRRWTVCLDQSDQRQLPRYHYATMVDMGNGSLLLFGGSSYNKDVNDLWRVDVCDQKDYLPLRENCVRWVQLTANNSNANYPSPRRASYAFMFSGSLFVFGGRNGSQNPIFDYCTLQLTDMWQFEVDRLKWRQVQQKGFNPLGLCSVSWSFAKWGTKVTAFQSTKFIAFQILSWGTDNTLSKFAYTFDVTLSKWSRQAKAPPVDTMALTFWDGKLVVLGTKHYVQGYFSYYHTWNVFTFLNPTCQAGQFSRQWENGSCESCPKGSYAALGSQQCFVCPKGLTTSNHSSTSLTDCVCRENYCNNGDCIVAALGKQRSAVCQCKTGYTGSTCKYPTYYLIGTAAVGVMLLICFVVLLIRFMTKYRRAKKNAEEELTSAHKVWNIRCNEVDLRERIDGETPGGYGEVYRGIYRDMIVAVKHLSEVMFSDQTIKKEFEREMEIMRGIRHPNLVMFFGAGEIEREEIGIKISYPFLVIEFMERGTLKKVLDSFEVSLMYKDKVNFALDAARGMQYLHALSPPRVHRDMKSANLLVSHS